MVLIATSSHSTTSLKCCGNALYNFLTLNGLTATSSHSTTSLKCCGNAPYNFLAFNGLDSHILTQYYFIEVVW